jgi:diphthamide biosynthesis protein 7
MLLPVLDEDVGGGIWRIKWHPTQRHRLALATMHDGFKVLDLSEADAGWTQAALEPYRRHESLAYGVDWNRSGTRLASCSFYDHMIALWTPA